MAGGNATGLQEQSLPCGTSALATSEHHEWRKYCSWITGSSFTMWAVSGLETATHLTAGKHKAELSGLVFINYLLIFCGRENVYTWHRPH
jgi:hypothetical protein